MGYDRRFRLGLLFLFGPIRFILLEQKKRKKTKPTKPKTQEAKRERESRAERDQKTTDQKTIDPTLDQRPKTIDRTDH